MIHLASVAVRANAASRRGEFPFNLPVVRSLERLTFDAPVTFFVGENGSGKSTILEGIAAACALPTVGSESIDRDATLAAQRDFGKALRLSWSHRTHKGFFLRAEDFFGFARRLTVMRSEMEQRLGEIAEEYRDRSAYARTLAEGPFRGSLAEMESRYGADLDAASHGQSFLKLFESRFVPGGLYLLDEPEAPLSPHSQLALIAMLAEMVGREAQFIIATHSPILLGFPDAAILSFADGRIEPVEYEAVEHVALTRDFLNDRQRYLRHLMPRTDAVG